MRVIIANKDQWSISVLPLFYVFLGCVPTLILHLTMLLCLYILKGFAQMGFSLYKLLGLLLHLIFKDENSLI